MFVTVLFLYDNINLMDTVWVNVSKGFSKKVILYLLMCVITGIQLETHTNTNMLCTQKEANRKMWQSQQKIRNKPERLFPRG